MELMAHLGKHGYKGSVEFDSEDLHDDEKWKKKTDELRKRLINYEIYLQNYQQYKNLNDGQVKYIKF